MFGIRKSHEPASAQTGLLRFMAFCFAVFRDAIHGRVLSPNSAGRHRNPSGSIPGFGVDTKGFHQRREISMRPLVCTQVLPVN